VAFWSDFVKWE
jgi:hypothetical protein